MLKGQRENEAVEEAAYRDVMKDYYQGRPFPKRSEEREDV